MKRQILVGALGLFTAAALVAPQIAHADETAQGVAYPDGCATGLYGPTLDGPVPTTVPPVPEDPDSVAAAVCVNPGLTVGTNQIDGGALAVGATADNGPTRLCADPIVPAPGGVILPIPVGAYVILDGNPTSTDIVSQTLVVKPPEQGYIGVSNYESGTDSGCPTDTAATTPNNGTGTNSGGYVGVKGVIYLPVPFVACGNTSGDYYGGAGRDGCAIP
jgi:hypothetical protein